MCPQWCSSAGGVTSPQQCCFSARELLHSAISSHDSWLCCGCCETVAVHHRRMNLRKHAPVYSSAECVGWFLLSLYTLVKRSMNCGCDESFWFPDEWMKRETCLLFVERSSLSFYLKEDLDWFPLCWHSCFSKFETLESFKICWRELFCPALASLMCSYSSFYSSFCFL